MSKTPYPLDRTAYLLVDPYNDFLSDGGKIFPLIKPMAEQNGLLDDVLTRIAQAPLRDTADHRKVPGPDEDAAWRSIKLMVAFNAAAARRQRAARSDIG